MEGMQETRTLATDSTTETQGFGLEGPGFYLWGLCNGARVSRLLDSLETCSGSCRAWAWRKSGFVGRVSWRAAELAGTCFDGTGVRACRLV